MRALLVILGLALAGCSPQPAVEAGTVPELNGVFEFDSLVIVNDVGESLDFDIYLALNPEQHRRGLMFVRHLPERTGMLFVYDDDGYHSMWMKNTYIPLDMIFARSDGSISSVITDTVPQTLNSIAAVEPVRYVLELNAGTTRLLQIGTSSRILWGDDDK